MLAPPAIALWFALTCTGAVLGQQSLDELTATLAQATTFDEAMVGDDGAKSDTYRTFERWRDRASTEQLVAFTQNASPIVRGYAVRALVQLEAPVDWPRIARGFLHDTAEVTTFGGCCQAKERIGDVCFTDARPRLTDEQILDFAELAIRGHSPLCAREWALRTLRLRDGMLHVVRELAQNGDLPAAIALARYRLAVDVPLLIRLLHRDDPWGENAQYLAAAASADPRLLAPLLALAPAAHDVVMTGAPARVQFWLQAIAAQRSDAAGAFLARFLVAAQPTEGFRERDLLATMTATLLPHADVAAFAAVRTELERRRTAPSR